MAERRLISSPDIAKADYYGTITIFDRRDYAAQLNTDMGWPISAVLDVEKELISVSPNDLLSTVETLMIMNDFSQLPVLSSGGRELHGSVTWESIAQSRKSKMPVTAQNVMDRNVQTARSNDNLLNHIQRIISHGFLCIRDPSNIYVGIVTATDLADGFLNISGPFIKLGEIEQRLRFLVDQLPLGQIKDGSRPEAGNKEITGASDLMFGEYVRILQKPENWNELNLPFDRRMTIQNLEAVNRIRNDVMHFRPGQLDSQAEESIDRCLNWLRATYGP